MLRSWNGLWALGVCCAVLLAWTAPAWGLSLDEAKAKGLVGEKPDGYLGVVSGGADVQALASDINQKRRQAYQEIATRNKTNLKDVETLAGQKAIDHTKPGLMIQSPSGQWMKK